MTAASSIDYDALTQEALRGMVRKLLVQVVAHGGLPGDHHFYIAFGTQAPGVVLSRRLKEKYPDEMMIVLQHRFWDLAVTDDGFEVKLTFDGIPERLYVPFEALRVFFDPSVRFTLQFNDGTAEETPEGGRSRRGSEGLARQAGRSRPRSNRAASRPESAGDDAPPVPAGPQPVVPNGPAPVPAAVPLPTVPAAAAPRQVTAPSQQSAASEQPPAKEGGGAKVFSLDQFRKKER